MYFFCKQPNTTPIQWEWDQHNDHTMGVDPTKRPHNGSGPNTTTTQCELAEHNDHTLGLTANNESTMTESPPPANIQQPMSPSLIFYTCIDNQNFQRKIVIIFLPIHLTHMF